MPWGRFLVPAIPLLAVAWTSAGAPAIGRVPAVLVLGGVIVSAALFVRVESQRGELARLRVWTDTCWRPMAAYLHERGRADQTLAVGDIGLPSYAFPGDVIDFFAIANPPLAHRRGTEPKPTVDDVLGPEPDWLMLYAGGAITKDVWPLLDEKHYSTRLMRGLIADPRLWARYRPVMQCSTFALVRHR